MSDQALDFQTIILSLQNFWSEKGCLIWQPYYTQVGAGTYNPATFLRVLGPEPWNVGYVEPSIRPDDGRYGDNPYRLQQHYQFQVILKPDPGNPQEIYLQSLQALGIEPAKHDIRFVEDNWVSPALGAWGLGWEVWLDGQEITQYTYFQQAGGIELEPVSVELTYGLERIAMALQGNYHFRKIRWNEAFTYGDVNYLGEKEHSTYYFDVANVESLRKMYDLFEKEAKNALEKGLVLPAHDYVLKCSHTFNILDTRGAVGVTERQALFGRMRDLSRLVAQAYLQQREELGFPWMEKPTLVQVLEKEKKSKQPALIVSNKSGVKEPQTFLLEVGTEDLPAGDLQSALQQLEEKLPALLTDLRLAHGDIQVLGTPRRLVVQIYELAVKQTDSEQLVKGPPAKAAFDAQGKATKAAEGFAKSKGLAVEDLQIKEIDGGEYATAVVKESGAAVFDVLPQALQSLLGELRFEKSMRWNESGVRFSRPVRWLLALFGKEVMEFAFAGLQAGRTTRGLRFSEPEYFEVIDAEAYFGFLKKQGILIDPAARKEAIRGQVQDLLASLKANPDLDEDLLDEVTNLVEAPTALLGNFEEKHLQLPREVLVGVMKKHQRYFPVQQDTKKLLPYFVTIRNGGKKHLQTVARGNEEVIEARFADAAFFIQEDLKKPLDAYLPKLDTLIFHLKLGSMLDKSKRIEQITNALVNMLAVEKEAAKTTLRAASLCKADLVTNMVVEMTALQGIMGRYYAIKSGESEAVATAIEEHYQPRLADDSAPSGQAGLLVGLADRLDSLVGLFAVGMAPSGSKDPFGLRRAAIGLVQNLIAWKMGFDLCQGIQIAAQALKKTPKVSPQSQEETLAFITARLENFLLEDNLRHDVVAAAIGGQGQNPYRAYLAAQELAEWVQRKDWPEILAAYARCVRITREFKEVFAVDKKLLREKEEQALYQAVLEVKASLGNTHSVDNLLKQFLPLIPAINAFFDKVLVMTEEEKLRKNRLGLVQMISALANGIADLSKLEGF